MSIFWLGGPEIIVDKASLIPEMYEDVYFKPGIIHGCEDHLIRIYLNDAVEESDPECFEVEYIWRDSILEAAKADPSLSDIFWEKINDDAEAFGCENDGTGDFATLVDCWKSAVKMTPKDLLSWAQSS